MQFTGTYTGDVVWLGMHDRRGGEDDADRQMIKVLPESCPLEPFLAFSSSSISEKVVFERFIHPKYDSPAKAFFLKLFSKLFP